MKKISLFFGVAVMMMTMASCYQAERESLQRANDSLMSVIQTKDSEMDSLYAIFNQIEENLANINASYNTVQQLRRNNMESGANVTSEIKSQMENIENLMAENKKKIASLQGQLSKQGKTSAELQELVNRQEQRITEQENRIAELLTELENNKVLIKKLNQDVSDLTASNEEKDQYISLQTAEANKAYYIVGTYKELSEAGIVSKEGGFIGIGRRQETIGNMPVDKFVQIDRTKATTITVNMKKATVISKHPENSYELVMDENDSKVVAYLRILNPAKFWEQTRYLVISTK